MAKIDHHEPGSFCWGELATTDTASAKAFYSGMFGWTVNEFPITGGVYTIFQSDGNDAAAMYPAPPGVPPNWTVYFAVTSADESAQKAKALGGTLIKEPFDVMSSGRMAVVQDPQGAVFCLWEARNHIGATHGGPLNMMTWPELATRDVAAAAAFYSGLFGWTTKPEAGLETAQYVELSNHSNNVGGILPMSGAQWTGVPPHWSVYVTVADCDAQTAKAKQLGGTVCVPPTDLPMTGRFAVIADAQGAKLSIIQLTHAPQTA